MSLLMRDLSPVQLREEILKLLLNQRLGQRRPPYGSQEGSIAPGMVPDQRYAGHGFSPQEFTFRRSSGSGGLDPAIGAPDYQEGSEGGDQPEIIPAIYDPMENAPANYKMCLDRCYQANRSDVLACYKKRGRVAKALCMTAAYSKLGSCNNACLQYKK